MFQPANVRHQNRNNGFPGTSFSLTSCSEPADNTQLCTDTHTHNVVLWPRPAVSEDSASSRPLIGPISPPLVSLFVLMKAPAILSNTCFWKGWTYCSLHLSKYNKISPNETKEKRPDQCLEKVSVHVYVWERDWQNGDEMESTVTQGECTGCKLWGMKDVHWKIYRQRLTQTGLWVRQGHRKNRGSSKLIVACIT